jgi:hypothetical protein
MSFRPVFFRVALLLGLTIPGIAADLELRFTALERLIAEQMFTQEGKRYVRGDARAKCQYAYLETPKLGAEQDRLRITARFSGRSAFDLMGRCVGLGDSFDLNLTALPVPRDGAIALLNVKVATLRDSYYIRRVRAALEQSFGRDFKIEVKEQARKLLEMPAANANYRPELSGFALNGVRVTGDALVLAVDFRLVVK